ncbi:hypothetical protein WN943_026652 [Citrus x changshan-huyou]
MLCWWNIVGTIHINSNFDNSKYELYSLHAHVWNFLKIPCDFGGKQMRLFGSGVGSMEGVVRAWDREFVTGGRCESIEILFHWPSIFLLLLLCSGNSGQ